jgi:hypothetical protein
MARPSPSRSTRPRRNRLKAEFIGNSPRAAHHRRIMTDTRYEFTYVMQRRDFVALTFAIQQITPWRFVATIVLCIIFMTGAYLLGNGPQAATILERPMEIVVLAGFEVVTLLFLIFPFRWFYLWYAASTVFRRNAAAGKAMRFVIDAAAIVGGMEGISTTVAWPAVTRLIEKPNHLFLAISRREAMILPRRTFANDTERAAFTEFARARFAATRSVDPKPQSA